MAKEQVDEMTSVKQQVGEIERWQNGKFVNNKLAKWLVDKTPGWWNSKLTKWQSCKQQVGKMASWQNSKLIKRLVDKTAIWWKDKLTKR